MNDYESLRKEYRTIFPDWEEEKIDEYARFMSIKYSTVKRGDNVIHLEYFEGLLVKEDIDNISSQIASVGLELSRFDKNGVPYASVEDFMLHVSLVLNDPVVGNLILGVSGGAMWDAIKASSILIWKKIRDRHWSKRTNVENKKKPLNFGLHVSFDKNTKIDLKLDGDLSEEFALKALDKAIDLIKITKKNKNPQKAKFFQTDLNGDWSEIDIHEEIKKQALKRKENNNGR